MRDAQGSAGAQNCPALRLCSWCHDDVTRQRSCPPNVAAASRVLPAACAGKSTSWRLPQREIKDLGTCMRRVARVLWALHVILQEVRFQVLSCSMSTSCHPAGGPLAHLYHLCVHSMASLLQFATACTFGLHASLESTRSDGPGIWCCKGCRAFLFIQTATEAATWHAR